jgi:guanylate kinase
MSEQTLERNTSDTSFETELERQTLEELLSVTTPSLDEMDETQLGMLLVLSGPAGVGKDTVWKQAAQTLTTFQKALTCTTRKQREHEVEGEHYHFVSNEEFDSMIRHDQLLEWAEVHGNRYGIPASSVLNRLNNGDDVICVIDVQGACRIRGLFPNSLLVFIKPPDSNPEVLKQRIEERGGASEAEIALRLKTAQWELTQTEVYDYQIINDNVEHAAQELSDIVNKEKAKRLSA